MKVVVEKLAFESPEINGHKISAWYLKEPDGDCLVRVTQGENLLQEFLYPAYKVWNLAAHADEIVASEIEKNMEGYRHAGSDGFGGGVMPRPVTE